MTVTVRDDGRGFDPGTVHGPHQGHFGLQGMRERAARLGGTVEIQSQPGAGTRIVMGVPLHTGVAKPGMASMS